MVSLAQVHNADWHGSDDRLLNPRLLACRTLDWNAATPF